MNRESHKLLLTQAAYARYRKVTRAMVGKYAKTGRLVIIDGKVDAIASDAILAESLDPSRGGKGGKSGSARPPSGGAATSRAAVKLMPLPDTYTRVRTHREAFNAKSAEAV